MLRCRAVSRDIFITSKRAYNNNSFSLLKATQFMADYSYSVTYISVSCLLSYGIGVNRDPKLGFADALLKKTMRVNQEKRMNKKAIIALKSRNTVKMLLR